MSTRYYLVSWVDPKDHRQGTREYGTTTTKQAAINEAHRRLAPGTDYIVKTLHETVADGVAGTANGKEAR
jgi:hypothetical protein